MTSFTGTTVAMLTMLLGATSTSQLRPARQAAVHVDISDFRRVWIAGFVTTANRDIDLNAELVRLLRSELKARTSTQLVEAAPLAVAAEEEFRDVHRWEKLGEEYGTPLIVTGTVRLNALAPLYAERSVGSRSSYQLRRGFSLEPTFVFIDGRTGELLGSEPLPKLRMYGADARTSTLSLFFQLMNRVVPQFLQAMGLEQALRARHRVI